MILVENQGDVDKFKDYKPEPGAVAPAPSAPAAAAAPAAAVAPVSTPAAPGGPPAGGPPGSRVYASPLAKKLAAESGVQLSGSGSGVFGSITSKDLAGMQAGAPAARASPMAAGLAQAHADRKG